MTTLLPSLALLVLASSAAARGPLPALRQAPGAALSGQRDSLRWEDLELPAHFGLDLESGVVTSRSGEQRPILTYTEGRLVSDVPLRALPWSEPGPRARVPRDLGEHVPGVRAEVGRELVFDLYGEAWGYLRVVAVQPERLLLEYVFEPRAELRELRRDPPELTARSGPRGVQLSWRAASGAAYRIDRRLVPQGGESPRSRWTELARVEAGSWFDERADATQLAEYRVCSVDGGFGARARGVGALAPAGELLHVGSNQSINLLSGEVGGERVDLEVEFVRSTGVQLVPGSGALARALTPAELGLWEVPELLESGYPRQRFFVAPGRVLALRLAEGAYVRVRVVSIDEQEVTLERQINLDGSRTFPPVPALDEARWDASRGVVLRFEPAPARPASERSGLVVERQAPGGEWAECARGAAGELELVDGTPTEELLVRYRFRRWLGGHALSPNSEPVAVLIGDDGAAGGEALLARALGDLGADDFARRERAREVLVALGERAWPGLREALRSDNPELALAARELLMMGVERDPVDAPRGSVDLAGLLLGVRAEELGAGAPAHPDWTSPAAGARACAALRGAGWRQVSSEHTALWRRVLAEVDPDEGVRLAATMAGALQREGLGPDLRLAVPGSVPWRSASIDAPLQPHPSTRESLAGSSRWAVLAALQAWHDLAAAARLGAESYDLALERFDLAQALVTQYERGGDELFLESALRVTADPEARLRAALDLLSMQRHASLRQHDDPRVVRLQSPDTVQLAAELEELKLDPQRALLILLPEGVYEPLSGGRQLVAEYGRVTLRARGRVVVRSGFTLMNGCKAVFEGLEIAPASGIALNLVRSDARLESCTLRAQNVGVMGMDSVLELIESTVLPAEGAGNDAAGVRLSGRSMLLASESRIEAEGVAVYGARAALFDSCVVLSRKRNALEGNGEGEVWAVGSLLSGAKLALARIGGGVLDGVVVLGGTDKAVQAGEGLRMCADHLWQRGDLGDVEQERWLEKCALQR